MSTNTYAHTHPHTHTTNHQTLTTPSTCAAADEFERRCRRLAGRAQTDWNAGQPNAGRPTWFSSGMCVLTAFCPGYGSFQSLSPVSFSLCLSKNKHPPTATPLSRLIVFQPTKWCYFVFVFSGFGFYVHYSVSFRKSLHVLSPPPLWKILCTPHLIHA